MAKAKPGTKKRTIEQYDHATKKRMNNPPVGLVTPQTDPDTPARKQYQYDPHLDPQLVWAGKAERLSFTVPTVSLHVHERIDPRTIIDAVRNKSESDNGQMPLFEAPDANPPLRDALDFYKHPHNWTNRLIAGDSLLVMNSLLEKEGMAGKVQMVYIDPPYGIRYGSNFQPFVNKRDVKDRKDEDLTGEPETLKAFRDTWELGIHSYLTYLRDRLITARELLSESGSVFVQIGDENVHLVRSLLEEVFGTKNFVSQITFFKTAGLAKDEMSSVTDYLLWFAKNRQQVKTRRLFVDKELENDASYTLVELSDGQRRRMTEIERSDFSQLPTAARVYRIQTFTAAGLTPSCVFPVAFENASISPPAGSSWKTNAEGVKRLIAARRLVRVGNGLTYVRYAADFPVNPLNNLWTDTASGVGMDKVYVVQTKTSVIQRCILMTTDPGDLVLDPTCGSGTTGYVAEQWGRRWITTDTSRVAITLAKQRLMTASFDYYKLAHPDQGVGSGFIYKTVPHVTLKSIANNPEIKEGMTREQIGRAIQKYADQETLYDQPEPDRGRTRITGPFTVEAVPSLTVRPLDETGTDQPEAGDVSVARSGATLRQDEWRSELLKTGVRGRGKQNIEFSRIEPLGGTRYLHALGETKEKEPKRVAISFGPEHAPLEQRQVEHAWEEARTLVPKPQMIVFAAFQFDPEAAKDIDELTAEKTGMIFLKVQMNADMLTEDLKKKRSSNESFWLIGQPDVSPRKLSKGTDAGKWQVEVHGFDYYNPRKGTIESGDTSRIAVWMLDTNYDGRSLYPRQVFFPMAGAKDGWAKLAKNLKAEIDEDKIEAYRGTKSLAFAPGKHRRAAVKIVDDRGIESLKILELE